jgi:hypothetical protein
VRFDHLDQVRRRGRIRVQHLGDHGHQARRGQVGQRQQPYAGVVPPAGQRPGQWIEAVQVVFTMGGHQQQTLDRLFIQQQVDESERSAPGPLQVIEEQDHRSIRGRDRPQDLYAVVLPAHLRGQRIPGVRRHPEQRAVLRDHRGHQGRVRAERRPDPRAGLGQVVLRLGQQQPAQRAERLVDPAGLDIPPVLVELAGHEPAARVGHHRP